VGGAPPFALHTASDTLPGWRESGDGQPLLLLHGWSVCGEAFDGQRALAARGYRLIVPDHAGHGLSVRRAGGTIASLARDVAALVTHLSLQDPVVVGWSMGAMVAWELMRSRPDLGLSVVGAIDMTPCMLSGPGWPHGLHGYHDAQQAARMAAHVRADWHQMVPSVVAGLWAAGRTAPAAQTKRFQEMALQCDPATLAALWEDMAAQDLRETLRAARLPLCHLYGECSQLYGPGVGRATRALQPGAGFAVIPGTGHGPHIERPEAFNDALLAVLAQARKR